MKTKTILLFTTISIFLLMVGAGCGEEAKLQAPAEEPSSGKIETRHGADLSWDYPVKPGTEGWRALSSHEEKVSVSQIPDDILKKYSTKDLLDICLNYPLSFDFYAYSSLKEGIAKVAVDFNGLRELFSREDNFSVLWKQVKLDLIRDEINSKTKSEERGAIVYRYSIIECLLGFDHFILNATKEELLSVIEETEKILEYKLGNKKIFSDYSNSASALLLGNALKKINPNLVFTKNTELFLKSGVLTDQVIIQELKGIF